MANGHGGARKGGGRKRNDPPTKLVGVYITEEQAKLLRMWGRGDVSAGLRWLVDSAKLLLVRRPAKPSEDSIIHDRT